jgi:hypothetical protein
MPLCAFSYYFRLLAGAPVTCPGQLLADKPGFVWPNECTAGSRSAGQVRLRAQRICCHHTSTGLFATVSTEGC